MKVAEIAKVATGAISLKILWITFFYFQLFRRPMTRVTGLSRSAAETGPLATLATLAIVEVTR